MTGAVGATAGARDLAVSVCRRAHARVEPALRAAVDRLPRHLARMSGYHLGWWGPEGEPTGRATPGKAVRPALAYLAAEALGAPAERATPGAAAVELVHNFALVHDDIMDGDSTRRGRPTLWQRYGTAAALLTGDGLHALAADTLAAPRTPRAAWAVSLLTRAMLATLRGQEYDHSSARAPWRGPGSVTLADYRRAAAAKTGALLAGAAAIGALLAGGGPRDVARFALFGHRIGVAFQCADDIIGLWGEPARTGKPVGSDLLAGRKTLPVLAALASGTDAGERLHTLLAGSEGRFGEAELRTALELTEAAGGRAGAEAEARRQREGAVEMVAALPMPVRVRTELLALADHLTARER
ncbi:polyprenyl synthetase family protein [Streptomyces albus subsp. chlorinus]|uniref:polyprenyl synthetase family protein n=1 Tax=Streptomyces albus TaxID=1888 RepID=UPI001570FC43|nr:polyprenyl synthetase family protein [Streptomyces albus]NSC25287.1 polyprenyl synthetase family protein [Streptomyces albus subsp. chlorinus]